MSHGQQAAAQTMLMSIVPPDPPDPLGLTIMLAASEQHLDHVLACLLPAGRAALLHRSDPMLQAS